VTVATLAQSERDLAKIVFVVRQLAEGRSNMSPDGVMLSADYTLINSNAAQAAFNATTNGAYTVLGNTTYEFEAIYLVTNTGTTSHTWSVLFGGTATFTSIAYSIQARTDTASAPSGNNHYFGYANVATAVAATAASTSATENVVIKLRGLMRVNAGGTVIPQVQLSAAPGGTQTMKANSFFRPWQIGSGSIATVGSWS
jgi:hypothetical protein